MFKLDDNEPCLKIFDKNKMISSSGKVNLRREIDTDEFKVSNGRYAVIPCSKNPGEVCEFSMSFFYDCDHSEVKLSKVNLININIVWRS